MKKFIFFGSLSIVILLYGCPTPPNKPDIAIPRYVNPTDYNGTVLVSSFMGAPFLGYNTNVGCQLFNDLTFVGNVQLYNEFYMTQRMVQYPNYSGPAWVVWNSDWLSPCAPPELFVGETVYVFKIIVNDGGDGGDYSSENSDSKTQFTLVRVDENMNVTELENRQTNSVFVPAHSYKIISEQVIYDGEGLYRFEHEVDANDAVQEDDEGNNSSNDEVVNILGAG